MLLARLQLTNFRNYARADVSPCAGITVFHGDNAQGKTALLEAVYLCCTGRSHRTSRDRELVKWEADAARVALSAVQADGAHSVDIALARAERKVVLVNGKPVSRSGELLGHITGVLFSPEDLRMVKDGPDERRRFIDMELSQIRPAYYYQLQRYHRALKQRAAILRLPESNVLERGTLDLWDEQLARSGGAIIEARRRFVERLAVEAEAAHSALSGGLERLTLAYETLPGLEGAGGGLQSALYDALQNARAQDLRRGFTSVGPHRDDLAIRLNGVDARAYGSQGQQRSAALSLKLAELRVMALETGETPVLMLDDVMSELDPNRRRQLLDALKGVQTLVTCTDLTDLAGADVGARYAVRAGVLIGE